MAPIEMDPAWDECILAQSPKGLGEMKSFEWSPPRQILYPNTWTAFPPMKWSVDRPTPPTNDDYRIPIMITVQAKELEPIMFRFCLVFAGMPQGDSEILPPRLVLDPKAKPVGNNLFLIPIPSK